MFSLRLWICECGLVIFVLMMMLIIDTSFIALFSWGGGWVVGGDKLIKSLPLVVQELHCGTPPSFWTCLSLLFKSGLVKMSLLGLCV